MPVPEGHREADPRGRERGHLLIAVMVGVTIMTILVSAAAEKWSTILRRDRETELVFRGLQYAQAISDYQKEHGALPMELEALLKKGPRNHRYIRQLYREPFNKEGKWCYLRLAPGGNAVINPLTGEMRPTSMLAQSGGPLGRPGGAGLPLGPQTPQDFGLRGPRTSSRFPGRGQVPPPSGSSLFRSNVTQISPYPPESLMNAPIAGVVSCNLKEKAFRMYEGYDRPRDFWFTAFKFGPGPGQQNPEQPTFIPGGVGPGGMIQPFDPARGRGRQGMGGPGGAGFRGQRGGMGGPARRPGPRGPGSTSPMPR
jgi:type II secretory pathway pseudopilin PulG